MRILRIISDLYPDVVGGLGVHAHEISRWQSEHGHEVKVFTVKRPTSNGFKRGYEVEKFRCLIAPKGNAFAPSMFDAILRNQNEYDILHAHSQLFFSTNMGAMARRFGKTPLVMTNHGMTSTNMPMWVQELYNPVARWTFDSADRIICYTKEDAQAMIDLGVDGSKIAIIKNGIDVNLFSPGDQPPSDGIQVVCSARFVAGKGHDILIDAFDIAQKEVPNMRLLLVGEGPIQGQVEKQISRLKLEDKIKIVSHMPNAEMPETYRASNIFMLTSHSEGVPRTLLESMACGLPVICTDLPQLRSIISDCGYMIKDSSTKEFGEALIKLALDEKQRRIFGANGHERIKNNYSWNSAMEKTMELYQDLVKEKKGHR